MVPAGRLDGDFNVLAEGGEKVHKALDRKVAGLPAHETGNVGLLDTEDLSRLRLGEAAFFDQAVDFERKSSFEVLPFRIGEAEVAKDVAAALFHSDSGILLHLSSAFLCNPVRPLRGAA
jgi:hypothetical protein